jgi:hypothetical protein
MGYMICGGFGIGGENAAEAGVPALSYYLASRFRPICFETAAGNRKASESLSETSRVSGLESSLVDYGPPKRLRQHIRQGLFLRGLHCEMTG